MSRLFALIPLFLAFLYGCPIAKGPTFFEAPPAEDQKGTFYFYRGEYSFDFAPVINLDDKPFVKLQRQGYSFTYLSPGIHRLAVKFNGGPSFKTEFEISSGQVIVIRLLGTGGQCTLSMIPLEKAREELQETRFTKPYAGF